MSASAPTAIVPLRGCSPYILAWLVAVSATNWFERDAPLHHALGEQDRQPRLDARNAVRHPAEAGAALGRELALGVVVAERAVVGREYLEHARLQPEPARLLARLVARRRAAHVLGALHVEAVEVLLGQHQVLRAGLAEHLQAALLRPADLLHGFAVGHVHDHDRHVDELGEADGAVRRLALHGDRPRGRVEPGRRLAGALQPLGEEADGVVVLGMHHHQRAGLARGREHLQQLDVACSARSW